MSTVITNSTGQHGVQDATNKVFELMAKETTCVRVCWQWLCFPAALVLLTLTFFAGVCWRHDARLAMTSRLCLWI